MLKPIRKCLRPILLRGPVRRWRSLRQCRRIEAAYLRELCHERDKTNHLPPDPPLRSTSAAGSALRTLLFIGDCLWEQNELFPEPRKIYDLRHLDLNPALKQNPQMPLPEKIVQSIEGFTRASNQLEQDVILFYARPELLSDEAFDLIRRRGKCPLLGMNLDDREQFFPYKILSAGNDDYGRWDKKFDVNLTNAHTSLD